MHLPQERYKLTPPTFHKVSTTVTMYMYNVLYGNKSHWYIGALVSNAILKVGQKECQDFFTTNRF